MTRRYSFCAFALVLTALASPVLSWSATETLTGEYWPVARSLPLPRDVTALGNLPGRVHAERQFFTDLGDTDRLYFAGDTEAFNRFLDLFSQLKGGTPALEIGRSGPPEPLKLPVEGTGDCSGTPAETRTVPYNWLFVRHLPWDKNQPEQHCLYVWNGGGVDVDKIKVPPGLTVKRPEEPKKAVEPKRETEPPWSAFGRVTDARGKGIAGVTIGASAGMGTLIPTGSAVTDKDGNYTLRFGPGRRSGDPNDWSAGTQIVIISPRLPGHFEKNLHRQGDLMMSDKPLAVGAPLHVSPNRVVLPNKPHRVDFVMLPAATIEGILLNREGKPLSGWRIDVTGKEMIPAASVLGPGAKTDKDGRFRIEGIPTGYTWRLNVLTGGWAEVRFDKPGVHRIEIRDGTQVPGGGLKVIVK